MNYLSCTRVVVLMGMSVFFAGTVIPQTAKAESPWLVKARLLGVLPDDSSTDITVIGGKAEVDDTITADLDISYFFTKNIAAALILGTCKNDVSAVDTAVGNLDLGDVWLLPPTLTAQYHFSPDSQFRPYVGAGVNYTFFYNADAGVAQGVDYDNKFGFALQAGFDLGLDEHWALNVDVKKIWLNTDVTVHALGTSVTTKVDIDPWLIGVGIAYRF